MVEGGLVSKRPDIEQCQLQAGRDDLMAPLGILVGWLVRRRDLYRLQATERG